MNENTNEETTIIDQPVAEEERVTDARFMLPEPTKLGDLARRLVKPVLFTTAVIGVTAIVTTALNNKDVEYVEETVEEEYED